MFYVNCGIYSVELAQIQSRAILSAPQEEECHFRVRIGSITPDTNMDDVRETLLNGLEKVIHFYDTITSAKSIADYYTSVDHIRE